MSFLKHTDALPGPTDATLCVRVAPSQMRNSGGTAPVAVPHFLGRYRVLEEIARGGMGIVVRAYDATLDREVAVKVLSPDVDPDSEIGRRFADEARIVSQMHHPGIVSVYDAGIIADGRPFFTMPFLQGHTLASVLANRADSGDEIDRFLAVFAKICGAVAHAHERRIVHRDLKPANVMLGRSDEVLVMDWGVAIDLRVVGALVPVSGNWVFGTPAYMPPEQANGNSAAHVRSDVFGLGAILCEILTGNPPYVGADVAAVARMAASAELDEAVARLRCCPMPAALTNLARRCLAPNADDRPSDAGRVAREIGVCIPLRRRDEGNSTFGQLDATRPSAYTKRKPIFRPAPMR